MSDAPPPEPHQEPRLEPHQEASFVEALAAWSQRWGLFLAAGLGGTWLDLATKQWAFDELAETKTQTVIEGWFSFTLATNKGAAFGLFYGQHNFFMIVSLVAFVAVPYVVHTTKKRITLTSLVMGLILAGVIGNFWDRVTLGEVRDFLDVHTPETGAVHDFFQTVAGRTVWPTFNVADVFITVGAGALIFLLGGEEEKQAGSEPDPEPEQAAAAEPGLDPLPESQDGPAPVFDEEPSAKVTPAPEPQPEAPASPAGEPSEPEAEPASQTGVNP